MSQVRLRVLIQGAVQGVGFRPFVHRLATEHGLNGWVRNNATGVEIEVEGERPRLEDFLGQLRSKSPPAARIQALHSSWLEPTGGKGFRIVENENDGQATTSLIQPDLATCADCLRELFDTKDRRYRYPFINCTNCGPRFSIIQDLPYDRAATTMSRFVTCETCRSEYENPLDRRFHAQPNACPRCGPKLTFQDRSNRTLSFANEALLHAARELRRGRVVALKGLGGFQLLADARSSKVIKELRKRKRRPAKPFALMVPDLSAAGSIVRMSSLEQDILTGPAAPIVLLQRLPDNQICPEVAPDNPQLGIMLPYTPLHHLLLSELGFPIVATSGNLSEEPICIDEKEALQGLLGIADAFLTHDRAIERAMDDSVVRVMDGEVMVIRAARGYAPLSVPLRFPAPPVLAVGGHYKVTIALSTGSNVVLSQHLGDLDDEKTRAAFERGVQDLPRLYHVSEPGVVCDSHPDYYSSAWAKRSPRDPISVQHHYAHLLSCMLEHDLQPPLLGAILDGTGWGTDGTIWGGEFLKATDSGFERVAHFRTFSLPGGDQAAREPRRSAAGLLYELTGSPWASPRDLPCMASFSPTEKGVLERILQRGINAPRTSSAGRLFDAVAALLNIRFFSEFEGQAAMALEFIAHRAPSNGGYSFEILPRTSVRPIILDWGPVIHGILEDLDKGVETATIASRFHQSLVQAIEAIAVEQGVDRMALSGGCFQNALLLERTVTRLRKLGIMPFWNKMIPINDGGLAVGQLSAALRVVS